MFAGDEVTVTDCIFNGVEGQYFWTGSASNVTFTRCQFNGVDRALKVLSVGNAQDETRNVTFDDCEFIATKANKAVLEFDSPQATSNYKVVLNQSMLDSKDVSILQRESGLKFFSVIPSLDDRKDNSQILYPMLEKLGLYKGN